MISKIDDPKARRLNWARCLTASWSVVLLCAAFALPAQAQDDEPLDAPPPLQVASRADVTRLRAVGDKKDRAKLAIAILNEHLTEAESLSDKGDNDSMFTSLGRFAGLMDHALRDLLRYDAQGRQPLDGLKRYDLGLRPFLVRLEILRRKVPYTHEYYIKLVMKQLQDAREKALEPLFGDTVIRMPNT